MSTIDRLDPLIPTDGLTLREVLALDVPAADRVWVASRPGACSERVQRLLAVRCARRALARIADPDPRSVAACEVAERHARGVATADELAAARSAACDAACAAARDAEREAQVADLLALLDEEGES